MGRSIAAAIDRRDDVDLVGTWTRDGDLESLARAADVIVDFTLPGATKRIADVCVASTCPLVCGVTGLEPDDLDALERAARSIPVVYDRNMSVGIAVLSGVLPQVARALGPGYRISVSETHHVNKKDAPSGTALKLGEAIERSAGGVVIAYSSERRGDVPGDHEVRFESPNESLRFAHSVVSRDVFADGALRAALWIVRQPVGSYEMPDVLSAD